MSYEKLRYKSTQKLSEYLFENGFEFVFSVK